LFSAFYPIQACPSSDSDSDYFIVIVFLNVQHSENMRCYKHPASGGQARSSQQPLAQRPGTNFLVVVVTGQMTLFGMFLVGGYIWRNPREHGGEHAYSTHKGPRDGIAID